MSDYPGLFELPRWARILFICTMPISLLVYFIGWAVCAYVTWCSAVIRSRQP